MERAQEVLIFWFQEPEGAQGTKKDNYHTKWFPAATSGAQAETDRIIHEQFQDLLEQAEAGSLDNWQEQPKSALALVVILDQFSRHIHRGDRPAIDRNDQAALLIAELGHAVLAAELVEIPLAVDVHHALGRRGLGDCHAA